VGGKTREQLSADAVQIGKELCETENPKLVMLFLAFAQHFSGDDLIAAINTLPEPFPMFGTMALADDQKPERNIVVNGVETSHDTSVFVACYGNVDPTFRVTTAFACDDEGIGASSATITESEGPVLKKVDNINAVEFMKGQGLITSDGSVANSSVWVVPSVLTYPNGTKIVRGFLGMDPDKGHVFAAGYIAEGAKISFANLSGEKTLSSTAKLFGEISEAKHNDIFTISCVARLWALGSQAGDEAKKIAEVAEEHEKKCGCALNYSLAYSGGEICPIKNEKGDYVNALHNYTIATCAFN